jgi:DNA-binding MarR family transcriptional regulator
LRVQLLARLGIIRRMDIARRPSPPTEDPGMLAWMRFLQAHAAVTRRLEADLQRACDISLAEYEALLYLDRADEGRLRMSELADHLLLSRSGVTRLIDRLAAGGDVERRSCASDARGSFAAITAAGRARLRAAAPVHVRGVREHFLAAIPDGELRPFGLTLGRLAPDDPERDAACTAALTDRETATAGR